MEPFQFGILLIVFLFLRILIPALLKNSLKNRVAHKFAFTRSSKTAIFNQYNSILTFHNNFYSNLSLESKQLFIFRCRKFIGGKNFIGMEGLKVTDEIIIRIAATAVQISFGLGNYQFSHYHTVRIYPGTFYSGLLDNYLKGGASPGGQLYFSWKDFEYGFADPSDKYNLGLHEMAHALRLQLRHGNDFDLRFASYADQWIELALPEFEKMNHGKPSFLREYGGTNIEEFFAVCIEHFFEVPEAFKKELPDIYNHLCFLLNLDPLRNNNDYTLDPGFIAAINSDPLRMPLPLKLNRAYQYDTWHWSFTWIVAGLFIGTPVIFNFYGKIFFTGLHIFLIILITTALVMFFRKFLYDKGLGIFHHMMFFCIAGAGPLVAATILFSNYFIKKEFTTKEFRIENARIFSKYNGKVYSSYYLLTLQNNAFKDYSDIRIIPSHLIQSKYLADTAWLSVTTSTGIWGLENFENKEVIIPKRQLKPH